MILTYLDSSALMRLIAREGDITPVEHAMQSAPLSSVLAKLELRAAISKRWYNADITEKERDALFDIAETQILAALTFLPLKNEVLGQAQMIVTTHSLRTLDALHIATAVLADRRAKRRRASLHFCTADRRQSAAAEAIFGNDRVIFVPPWR